MPVLVCVAALGLAFPGAPSVAQVDGAAPAGRAFDYERGSAALVVSMIEYPSEAGEGEPGRWVQVYGDGRVRVHYPSYSKRRGEYTLMLTRDEMQRMLRSLVASEFVEFDADAVRGAKRARALEQRAAEQRGEATTELVRTFDASTFVIELRLRSYRSHGAASHRAVDKRVTWRSPRLDARHNPELRELQQLAAVQAELEALMQRPDLTRTATQDE